MQISEAIWTQILHYITVMNKTAIITFHIYIYIYLKKNNYLVNVTRIGMERLCTITNAYMLYFGDSVCVIEAECLSFVCVPLIKEVSRQLRWRNDTTGC